MTHPATSPTDRAPARAWPDPMPVSVVWFRKGLRLHDNAALQDGARGADALCPLYILDPALCAPGYVGDNRLAFLLESLRDLDAGLRRLGSRLVVRLGSPDTVLPGVLREVGATRLTFEADTEPYAVARDAAARTMAETMGIEVLSPGGHTLYPPGHLLTLSGGRLPTSYSGFLALVDRAGLPAGPLPAPAHLPPVPDLLPDTPVPTLADLGRAVPVRGLERCPPGETAALDILRAWCAQGTRIATFEKPKTDPTAFDPPSTTRLGPHLKFGCLSPRTMYHALRAAEAGAGRFSKPPVSLVGQLLWREFFTTLGAQTPNYDRMRGNPLCRQISWGDDPALLQAWEAGRTGYPWIDAAMRQLAEEGWMHHLARHSVACFLTRGDLWQSWEAGQAVFGRLLIDGDWSLNAANWMWLSASAFFHQYDRVYNPATFAEKYPGHPAYIRRYVPELAALDDEYILQPWTAPPGALRRAGVVLGKTYPVVVVDHHTARKQNLARMREAYGARIPSDAPAVDGLPLG